MVIAIVEMNEYVTHVETAVRSGISFISKTLFSIMIFGFFITFNFGTIKIII